MRDIRRHSAQYDRYSRGRPPCSASTARANRNAASAATGSPVCACAQGVTGGGLSVNANRLTALRNGVGLQANAGVVSNSVFHGNSTDVTGSARTRVMDSHASGNRMDVEAVAVRGGQTAGNLHNVDTNKKPPSTAPAWARLLDGRVNHVRQCSGHGARERCGWCRPGRRARPWRRRRRTGPSPPPTSDPPGLFPSEPGS